MPARTLGQRGPVPLPARAPNQCQHQRQRRRQQQRHCAQLAALVQPRLKRQRQKGRSASCAFPALSRGAAA
eukprot:15432312-Alexandrium_andersonii.AAC.1